MLPVTVGEAGAGGIALEAAAELPPGGRRAGLISHSYRAKLIGLSTRQHTGWLEVDDGDPHRAVYAPHTEGGFKAPANKTLLLLANGFLARRGLREARKSGRAQALQADRTTYEALPAAGAAAGIGRRRQRQRSGQAT